MLLEDIKAKLETVDPHVFYGLVDESEITDEWNYTVFMRKSLGIEAQKRCYTDRFVVAVIRENYIPEGLETAVIGVMCDIPGMRIADTDGQYSYTRKPNTNTVVEVLTLEFVRARKRDAA